MGQFFNQPDFGEKAIIKYAPKGNPLLEQFPGAKFAYSLRDLNGDGRDIVQLGFPDKKFGTFTTIEAKAEDLTADGLETLVKEYGARVWYVLKIYDQSGNNRTLSYEEDVMVGPPPVIYEKEPILDKKGFVSIRFEATALVTDDDVLCDDGVEPIPADKKVTSFSVLSELKELEEEIKGSFLYNFCTATPPPEPGGFGTITDVQNILGTYDLVTLYGTKDLPGGFPSTSATSNLYDLVRLSGLDSDLFALNSPTAPPYESIERNICAMENHVWNNFGFNLGVGYPKQLSAPEGVAFAPQGLFNEWIGYDVDESGLDVVLFQQSLASYYIIEVKDTLPDPSPASPTSPTPQIITFLDRPYSEGSANWPERSAIFLDQSILYVGQGGDVSVILHDDLSNPGTSIPAPDWASRIVTFRNVPTGTVLPVVVDYVVGAFQGSQEEDGFEFPSEEGAFIGFTTARDLVAIK
tara:strand:- start:231 stop:1625 length:1395 start_codon:yes stop_codon:yes gene_type:complete